MKIWEWLKTWWKWVLLGVAVLGSFITGLLLRKTPVVVTQPPEKKDAEDEAAAEKARLEQEAQKKTDQVTTSAEKGREDQVTTIKETSIPLIPDPQKTNDYLKQVSEEMQKP